MVLSQVRFNRAPEKVPEKVLEKVPEKVPEKVWEGLVQSQVGFNRDPEKVPQKVPGNHGAKPSQVQRVRRRLRKNCKYKTLRLLGIPPKLFLVIFGRNILTYNITKSILKGPDSFDPFSKKNL